MQSQPALVDAVREIRRERPATRKTARGAAMQPIRVRFGSGVDARLNPASSRDRIWAEILESLRESGKPAYVEIDPDTRYITSLLLPQSLLVTAIRETPESDLVVELEISHARHYLRRDHPRFQEMHALLEEARRARTPVLVTESLDRTAIVDVRPARAGRRK